MKNLEFFQIRLNMCIEPVHSYVDKWIHSAGENEKALDENETPFRVLNAKPGENLIYMRDERHISADEKCLRKKSQVSSDTFHNYCQVALKLVRL